MTKRTLRLSYWLFMWAICCATSVSAQQWGSEGELEDVEIEIIKERQISLPKASRNFEKVPPQPVEPVTYDLQYNFRPLNFQGTPVNTALRPLKLKQEDPSKIYRGYLSAGYGNYASPYLEGFINSGKDKNKLIGARGLFSASDKGPVDARNSGSGLTLLSVYGKTFTNQLALTGDVGFENRSTHFYGYSDGTGVDRKDIRQSFNTFYLKGSLSNVKKTDFSYKLAGAFSHMGDRFDASESEFGATFNSQYKVSDESEVGIDAGYFFIRREDSAVKGDPRNLFFVNPKYSFSPLDNLKISAGIVASVENDTIDNKNVHAYPDIRASYAVSESVTAVASLTGGIEKVSLQQLSNENMWVAPNIAVFHTNKVYDFSAGLLTRVGKVSLNGGVSFASLKNWYFFVNDPTDQSRFQVAYDPGNTLRTNLYASVAFAQADKVNVQMRADFFDYKTDELTEAWHRPTYRVTASSSFMLATKILLDFRLISQGGMKAFSASKDKVVELDALDLSSRVEYLLSDSFSAFVQLNNITAREYPLFLNYPARGFQALGGITWKF